MEKSREELQKELDIAIKKLVQYQHKAQRLENRLKHYQQGKRRKRAHRLITRGAAVESLAPAVHGMGERAFFPLMGQVFSLPEVAVLVNHAADQQEGD